jgi:hypothetical protein
LSSNNRNANRDHLRRSGSRRHLMKRSKSEGTFGASHATFEVSCSSLLSIPWESLKENGDAASFVGSLVSGCVPSLSGLDDSATHGRPPSRQVLRTSSWGNVAPVSLGVSSASQLSFISFRPEAAFDQEMAAATFPSNATKRPVLRTNSWQEQILSLRASCVSYINIFSTRSESGGCDEQTIGNSDQESMAASFSSQSELELSLSSSASTAFNQSAPIRVLKRFPSNSEVSSLSATQSSNMELASASDSRSSGSRSRWLQSKLRAPPRLPFRSGVTVGTPDRSPPRQPSRTCDSDDAGQGNRCNSHGNNNTIIDHVDDKTATCLP